MGMSEDLEYLQEAKARRPDESSCQLVVGMGREEEEEEEVTSNCCFEWKYVSL
jgi:hypothetical protein